MVNAVRCPQSVTLAESGFAKGHKSLRECPAEVLGDQKRKKGNPRACGYVGGRLDGRAFVVRVRLRMVAIAWQRRRG